MHDRVRSIIRKLRKKKKILVVIRTFRVAVFPGKTAPVLHGESRVNGQMSIKLPLIVLFSNFTSLMLAAIRDCHAACRRTDAREWVRAEGS